nr:MAG TPA: hypothetical protein [Caudoviricetes sp.]
MMVFSVAVVATSVLTFLDIVVSFHNDGRSSPYLWGGAFVGSSPEPLSLLGLDGLPGCFNHLQDIFAGIVLQLIIHGQGKQVVQFGRDVNGVFHCGYPPLFYICKVVVFPYLQRYYIPF